ncbi:MAG: tetratricopeptide repeat protein [Planctomycetota bacterium]
MTKVISGRTLWGWVGLGAILLVGAGSRLLYLRELVDKPDFTVPAVDAGFHDYWARGLATGNWRPPFGLPDPLIRQTAYLRPPGYPYFLSLIYTLFGTGYLAPRIVQLVLGLINVILAFLFARKWFGLRVGLVLGLFMACYWIFVYFEGEFHAPVLVIYLLWLLVYAAGLWAERLDLRHALATGLLLGIAALVLPNALVFLPVLLGWSWWVARRHGERRRVRLAVVGLVAGTAVAVAPATIRNYRVAHDFVLISSNAGVNLYLGNNETATGVVSDRIPGLGDFKTCHDYPALVRNLERKLGRALKPSAVSGYFVNEALRFVREHPADFLKLTLKKALLFWGPREITHNKAVSYERAGAAVLRNLPGNFSLVVALAAMGGVLLVLDRRTKEAGDENVSLAARRRWEMAVLLLALVVAYFLSVLPFFVSARYRVPIIPFLLLFASFGVCRVAGLLWARQVRHAAAWTGTGVVLYGFHVLAGGWVPGGERDLAKWHYDRAVAYGLTGRTDQAIDEYRAVLESMPQNPHAHLGLGTALARRGETDAALEQFYEALRLWPEYAEAHFYLGVAMAAQGRTAEALAHYADAIRCYPDYLEAHYNLGALLAALGRYDEALSHYQEALRINPDFIPAHTNAAVVFFQQDRLDEAEREFREVVRLEPGNTEARCNLAITLTHQGRFDEAAREYQTVLRIDPRHPTAQAALAELMALRKPGR